MGTIFDDSAAIKHHDPVQTGHRGQTMRNHDARTTFHEGSQGILNQLFTFRIERTCCFIKHQHWAVGQERTRNGDTLTLAAGKLDAAFSRDGVKSLRKLLNKLKGIGLIGRSSNLFHAGIGFAIRDIFGDGTVE